MHYKIATIIIGVLLLVPPPQWHPHEAHATCKISYVICATAKAIIHGNAPIPYASIATAKVTSHGNATSIKDKVVKKKEGATSKRTKFLATVDELGYMLGYILGGFVAG